MDCDLQDKPEEIAKIYAKAQEDYDLVLARRQLRVSSIYRRFVSWLFIHIYNWLSVIKVDNSISNFSISSRRVIDSVRRFRERNRSFPILRDAVGIKSATVDVKHVARFAGKSSYDFWKLDFTIKCIVAQSSNPLRLSIKLGFALAVAAGLYALLLIFRYFYFGTSLQGWTSTIVVVNFFHGLSVANLGVMGLYLGKIFDEVKDRPLYFVETALNLVPPVPVPPTTGTAPQPLAKE